MKISENASTDKKVPGRSRSKQKAKLADKPDNIVFPLKLPEDGQLRVNLLGIASKVPTRDARDDAYSQARTDLHDLIKRLQTDDSSVVGETYKLKDQYERLSFGSTLVHLKDNLESEYKLASLEQKTSILKILLVLERGYSSFIGKILENGKIDPRYKHCIDFLKTLVEPSLEAFIYRTDPSGTSSRKLGNLANALLELADERMVFDLIQQDISEKTSSDSFNTEEAESKILLLSEVIKRFKGELEFAEVTFPYRFSLSWYSAEVTARNIVKRFKDKAPDFFLQTAKNNLTLEDVDDPGRASAIRIYSYLMKEKAIDEISGFISDLSIPKLISPACDGLIRYCKEEGMKVIEDAISGDLENDNPSFLLATLIVNSQNDPVYDDILKRIFTKQKNLIKAFKNIADSRTTVIVPKQWWYSFEDKRASISYLTKCIGLTGNRLINWIIKEPGETLRKNARDFLTLAIVLDKGNRLAKAITRFRDSDNPDAKLFNSWLNMESESNSLAI